MNSRPQSTGEYMDKIYYDQWTLQGVAIPLKSPSQYTLMLIVSPLISMPNPCQVAPQDFQVGSHIRPSPKLITTILPLFSPSSTKIQLSTPTFAIGSALCLLLQIPTVSRRWLKLLAIIAFNYICWVLPQYLVIHLILCQMYSTLTSTNKLLWFYNPKSLITLWIWSMDTPWGVEVSNTLPTPTLL